MLEVSIERRLVEKVKRLQGWAVKFDSPGTAGMPDRLVILPEGRMIFVELKAPGKRPRPLQQARIDQLKKLGCRVYVLDSPAAVDQFIEELTK